MYNVLRRLQEGHPVWMSELISNVGKTKENKETNSFEWWNLVHPNKTILSSAEEDATSFYNTKYFMVMKQIISLDTNELKETETWIIRRPNNPESKWTKEVLAHYTNMTIKNSWKAFFHKLFVQKKHMKEQEAFSLESRAILN